MPSPAHVCGFGVAAFIRGSEPPLPRPPPFNGRGHDDGDGGCGGCGDVSVEDLVVVAAGSLGGGCCVMPAVFVVVVEWLVIDVGDCSGVVLSEPPLRVGNSSSSSMSMVIVFPRSIRSKLTRAGDRHRLQVAPRETSHQVAHPWHWNMPGDCGPTAAAFLSPSCKNLGALLKLRELEKFLLPIHAENGALTLCTSES